MHRMLLFILLTTSLFAKDIIAVLDLETIGLNPGEATILTQRLTTKLISIGKYEVVERTNMDKILKEQKFQKSGCTDSGCAVEIGQLLNTDYIVIGSVNKFGSTWTLDARLIDVALGKGIISAEFSEEGKIDVLLTKGLSSIANQLCGMETTKQSPIESSDSATPSPSESGTVATEPTQTKGKLINSVIGSNNSQKDNSAQDIKSVKQKKKNWYFTLLTLESRMPGTPGEVGLTHASLLQTRYKNIQFTLQSGVLDGCTDEIDSLSPGEDLYTCNDASSYSSYAIGYYRDFNISNINIFQKINVNNIGFNYWYHFQPILSTFVENHYVTETSVPFHQLSLEIETKKYFSFGLRLELGTILFFDIVPSDLYSFEGFFLKAGINMLSFGKNY